MGSRLLARGELLGVEGDGKRVSKIGAGGAVTTLTEGIAGHAADGVQTI